MERHPPVSKMQINHPDKGFIVADDFSSSEAATFNFFNLMDAKIEKGTIIEDIYERQDKKQVNNGKIYGLTILNEQPIYKLEVHYHYLRLLNQTEISLK
jgi:hypothetical protein